MFVMCVLCVCVYMCVCVKYISRSLLILQHCQAEHAQHKNADVLLCGELWFSRAKNPPKISDLPFDRRTAADRE